MTSVSSQDQFLCPPRCWARWLDCTHTKFIHSHYALLSIGLLAVSVLGSSNIDSLKVCNLCSSLSLASVDLGTVELKLRTAAVIIKTVLCSSQDSYSQYACRSVVKYALQIKLIWIHSYLGVMFTCNIFHSSCNISWIINRLYPPKKVLKYWKRLHYMLLNVNLFSIQMLHIILPYPKQSYTTKAGTGIIDYITESIIFNIYANHTHTHTSAQTRWLIPYADLQAWTHIKHVYTKCHTVSIISHKI